MPTHDAQVLKGILTMLLLQMLCEQQDYGYSVVLRLQAKGLADLREGTVYPALTRLERQGFLRSRLVPSEAGPARKYYEPTDEGLAELGRARAAWTELNTTIARVLGPNESRTP